MAPTLDSIHQPPADPFRPHRLLRNGTLQTLLARWQPPMVATVLQQEQPVLLDAGPDLTEVDRTRAVRLLGYYNRAPQHTTTTAAKGLVLLLHGWEGCSHAVHNLVMARSLLEAGYDVFRLNLRDHGPGRHVNPYLLNKGLFLATLLDETAAATMQIAALAGARPFYIVGPSMGGNFALRLAIRHGRTPFPNLRRVIAVSPAIDPAHSTRALDRQPFYLRYFRTRWLASLRAKQRLFPELYDFSDIDPRQSVFALTDYLVRKFGLFAGADEYFAAYTVANSAFDRLSVATHIVTAANDAVIPVADFYAIAPHPLLTVHIHPDGGHVGFVDLFPLQHRLPAMVLQLLGADLTESPTDAQEDPTRRR